MKLDIAKKQAVGKLSDVHHITGMYFILLQCLYRWRNNADQVSPCQIVVSFLIQLPSISIFAEVKEKTSLVILEYFSSQKTAATRAHLGRVILFQPFFNPLSL